MGGSLDDDGWPGRLVPPLVISVDGMCPVGKTRHPCILKSRGFSWKICGQYTQPLRCSLIEKATDVGNWSKRNCACEQSLYNSSSKGCVCVFVLLMFLQFGYATPRDCDVVLTLKVLRMSWGVQNHSKFHKRNSNPFSCGCHQS